MLAKWFPLTLAFAALIGLTEARAPGQTPAEELQHAEAKKTLADAAAKAAMLKAIKSAADAEGSNNADLVTQAKNDAVAAVKAAGAAKKAADAVTAARVAKEADDAATKPAKVMQKVEEIPQEIKHPEATPLPTPRAGDRLIANPLTATIDESNLDRLLYHAAWAGSFKYHQGQYAEATAYFRHAILAAWPYVPTLQKKYSHNDGLVRRVSWAMIHTTGVTADWRTAVILRTAVNDIRNARLRDEYSKLKAEEKQKKRENLVQRMGGFDVVHLVFWDATNRASRDAGLRPGDGNPLFFQAFTTPAFQPFLSTGVSQDPMGGWFPPFGGFHHPMGGWSSPFAGHQHLGYLRGAYLFGLGRHLYTALHHYCVPEPEIEEFLQQVHGDHELPFFPW
jgi:hypothetical protein